MGDWGKPSVEQSGQYCVVIGEMLHHCVCVLVHIIYICVLVVLCFNKGIVKCLIEKR